MALFKTAAEKKQEEFLNNFLESIQPTSEEYIERRIHHITFAKMVCWICFQKERTFHLKSLRSFLRLEESRVYNMLVGLVNCGFLTKTPGKSEFHIITDEYSKPKLARYIKEASKTLGKTLKREISFKIEDEEEAFL